MLLKFTTSHKIFMFFKGGKAISSIRLDWSDNFTSLCWSSFFIDKKKEEKQIPTTCSK